MIKKSRFKNAFKMLYSYLKKLEKKTEASLQLKLRLERRLFICSDKLINRIITKLYHTKFDFSFSVANKTAQVNIYRRIIKLIKIIDDYYQCLIH